MAPVKFNESEESLQLNNDLILFQFNLERGTYDIIDLMAKKPVITELYYQISVTLNGSNRVFSSIQTNNSKWDTKEIKDVIGTGLMLTIYQTHPELEIQFRISLYSEMNSIFIQISFKVVQDSINLINVKPFLFQKGDFPIGSAPDLRILKNDWQSWSSIEVVDLSFKENRSNVKVERRGKHAFERNPKAGEIWSHYLSIIKNLKTKNQLFLGFISLANQHAQIIWKIERKKQINSIQAICSGDSILLAKDDQLDSEILMISIDSNPTILERWAEITGNFMNKRTSSYVPFGWCSWYQYFKAINEEKIKLNLEVAQKLKEQIPIEYFQIDDGYEPKNAMGDWLETEPKKFPKGLKDLAQQIKDAGFKPGIWLAPFLISNNSKLFKNHEDWILRNKTGKKIWGAWPFLGASSILKGIFKDRVYSLDLTNPEVQSWLKSTIETLVKDFGFTYLKIDFIYAGAIEAVRYNPKMTRIQAYRKGLEIIREAAGEETFILGCGAPYGPSIGIVDAMRVSTDTAPGFKVPFILNLMNNLFFAKLENIPSIENAMQQNIQRFFFHNNFWINDPDTLIVRHESGLSLDELRFEITVIGLLGGLLLISDNMANYTSKEIELIQILIPPSGITARPLYMLKENYPSILMLDLETPFDKWKLIGVLNWSNKTKAYTLNLDQIFDTEKGIYHVFEFWDRKYFGIQESIMECEPLNKHSAKLYSIRQMKDKPSLLSSSFHITQGGTEVKKFDYNEASGSIQIDLEKEGICKGELFIFIPSNLLDKKINIIGEYLEFKLSENTLIIKLEIQNKTTLVIELK